MKRRTLYFCILLLIFSCNKDEESFITLSRDKISFGWSEETKVISVESNQKWLIDSELPVWLSLTRMKNSNDDIITLSVSENRSKDTRFCNLVFTTQNQEKTIHVEQSAKERLLFCGEKLYTLDNSITNLAIEIDCNVDYFVIISEDAEEWIKQETEEPNNNAIKSSGTINQQSQAYLKLNIVKNREDEERYATIIINNEFYNLSDTIFVVQKGIGNYFLDGDFSQFEQSSNKYGVNLVIMGDGFTREDLQHGGRYETCMKQASDYFFSIEPYNTFKEFFNVYMVVAESEEEGVSDNGSGKKVRNKFETAYGNETEITCNSSICFEYAQKITDLPSNLPLTIVIVLNSTKYAGTTYLFSNGNSIALCPMSNKASPNDFEGLIHHEAGGHGFGFLCDEYVYYQQQIPNMLKQEIKEWQQLGFFMNLDVTGNLSTILWKDFIGLEKYSQVGMFEGGYEYQYGIWRSELNSCMNNNVPYYNVQSRWSIVNRLMKLSGLYYSIDDFIKDDHFTFFYQTNTKSESSIKLEPLGKPILIK